LCFGDALVFVFGDALVFVFGDALVFAFRPALGVCVPARAGVCVPAHTPSGGWYPGWELNPHFPYGKRDFKSLASASFATRARSSLSVPEARSPLPASR
jgi:hypothetical protein